MRSKLLEATRARLVVRELHGDALRHAGPDEVSHGRPAEVVRNPPGTTRGDPCQALSKPLSVSLVWRCQRLLVEVKTIGHVV
jgi:hypothetical protein